MAGSAVEQQRNAQCLDATEGFRAGRGSEGGAFSEGCCCPKDNQMVVWYASCPKQFDLCFLQFLFIFDYFCIGQVSM